MSTPISLTAPEQKQLRLQARRSVGRVSERIHYVLLFSRGHTPDQIAALYEVDERTVQDWLERFRQHGAKGLDDRPRSGRPRLATVAAHTEAKCALEAAPQDAGAEPVLWTRRLLQRHLTERTDCRLSLPTLTRLIKRLGFVWRRPKLVLKQTDPLQAEREAAIAEALAAHPEAPRLYMDECDLHQLPVVRGQWQRRGQQKMVATPGNNRKQAVFGFLEAVSGRWHYFLTHRKRSFEFLSCLHELDKTYSQRSDEPLLLFLDNASIHKSKTTPQEQDDPAVAGKPSAFSGVLPACLQWSRYEPCGEGLVGLEEPVRSELLVPVFSSELLVPVFRRSAGCHPRLLRPLHARRGAPLDRQEAAASGGGLTARTYDSLLRILLEGSLNANI